MSLQFRVLALPFLQPGGPRSSRDLPRAALQDRLGIVWWGVGAGINGDMWFKRRRLIRFGECVDDILEEGTVCR